MAELDFEEINRINSTESDQDSPGNETFINKLVNRDNEAIEAAKAAASFYYGDKRDNNTGNVGEVIVSSSTDWNALTTSIGNSSDIIICDTFTLQAGVTLTLAQGRPAIIYALTSVTINGTLDGDGKGGLGGLGTTSNGNPGAAGSTGGSGGNGGNGISAGNGGIGGAGFGVVGGGLDVPIWATNSLIPVTSTNAGGGGGGAGGEDGGGTGHDGGDAGGAVFIISPVVIIGASGIITVDGENGAVFPGSGGGSDGGSGGGGGGSTYIRARTYINSGSVVAGVGGAAGDGDPNNGTAGGNGILIIDQM